MSRELTQEERALKSATGALVEAVGGAKIALRLLAERGHEPAQSMVYDYCNPGGGRHFMPIHYVAILERAAGRPIVTAHAAAELGAEIVPAASVDEGGRLDAMGAVEAILALCRKSGGLKRGLDEAAADGVIDAGELRELRALARRLLGFVWQLVRKLERA